MQGVGFRPFVHHLAERGRLSGYVLNSSAGLETEVEGTAEEIERCLHAIRNEEAPPLAWIQEMTVERVASVLPHRVRNPPFGSGDRGVRAHLAGRRHLRRLSPRVLRTRRTAAIDTPSPIARTAARDTPSFRDIPYDRASTTMSAFRMCEACQREYDNPADRRFHAQPDACSSCGPELALERAGVPEKESGDADCIASVIAALAKG